MYLLFAILLPALLLLLFINHRRKRRNMQRVRDMCPCEKYSLLDELLEPFGYSYVPSQDIFTSHTNAWQRDMGYCALYDKAAAHFRMIFDALPVYFNYREKTWLLELWKGQYGITTGGEIGLYYADRILAEHELNNTLFQSAENPDMLRMSSVLYRNGRRIATLTETHWWLTSFHLGLFSQPEDLTLRASIDFPNVEMASAFKHGLRSAGYSADEIYQQCNSVTFSFDRSKTPGGIFRRLRIRYAQCKNRFWCKIFLFITRPFETNVDRVLYLYYYLPFAFRRSIRIRRYKKYKPHKKKAR